MTENHLRFVLFAFVFGYSHVFSEKSEYLPYMNEVVQLEKLNPSSDSRLQEASAVQNFSNASEGPCDGARCKYGKCVLEGNEKICKCNAGHAYHEKGICRKCNCGPNEISCTFTRASSGYKVNCICKSGYADKNSKCESCSCGGIYNCTFIQNGKQIEKKCDCPCGHKEVGGKCVDPCAEVECGDHGRCEWDDASSKPKCTCRNGFTGDECEVDPCTAVNCGRNGKCIWDEEATKVKCSCEMGWAGDECEKEMDKCATNPCKNGGTCWTVDSNPVCSCLQYFTGKQCEDSVWCKGIGKDICGNIPCEFDAKTETGHCRCGNKDSYFDRVEKTCISMEDQCTVLKFNGNCSLKHETCSNGKCECEENYVYSETKTECEPDFCGKKRGVSMCQESEECLILENDKIGCVCKDGYYRHEGICKRVDRCAPTVSNCTQFCRRSTGECYCARGFKLNDDKVTCSIVDTENSCDKDCGSGSCIKSNDQEICICPQTTHSVINGTCLDKCTARKVPAGLCPGGQCMPNEERGFSCKCEGLYKQHEDGFHCQRKLMCTEGGGDEECLKLSATCTEDASDKTKGYRCVCNKGYEADENGICTKKCDIKKNRLFCDKQFALCTLDADYEVTCKCPPYLRRMYENGPCNEIDRTSFIGNLTIKKDRYQAEEKGFAKKINRVIDYTKLDADLLESFKGVYADIRDIKLLSCNESSSALFCTIEVQFGDASVQDQVNLITAPSICVALDTKYCWVKPNLVLQHNYEEKVFRKTDPCMTNVKEMLCGDTTDCSSSADSKSFQCTCAEGFHPRGSYNPTTDAETFIQKCLDIDECLNSTSCPNSTECLNTFGSYKCLCKSGYRKKSDTEDPKTSGCIAVCEPNPCLHGSCMQIGNHGFACNCGGAYTGYLCNSTNDVLTEYAKKGNQKAAVAGGVLGALLFVTLVAGYFLFRRLKKQNEDNGFYSSQRQRNIFAEMTRQGNGTAGDIEGKREQRLQSGAYQKGYGRGSEDGSLELHETRVKKTERQYRNKAFESD